jgi:hypothetical protein
LGIFSSPNDMTQIAQGDAKFFVIFIDDYF